MPPSTVLITGATGLIGRRLLPHLVQAGHEVHVIGRNRPITPVAGFHRLDLLQESGRLPNLLGTIKASHAVHLAWYAEPGKFWSAPQNLDWLAVSLTLASAFAAAGGRRLITAGTCAEYDWTGGESLDEEISSKRPASAYGAAKLALGNVLLAHSQPLGLSYANARIFFPYAADEHSARLLGTLIAAARRGQPACFTAGTQARDFIPATEVAAAMAALLYSNAEGPVNVGTGRAIRVRDFIETAAALLDRPVVLEFAESSPGNDQAAAVTADVRRLVEEVGFRPSPDFSIGLSAALQEAGLRQCCT